MEVSEDTRADLEVSGRYQCQHGSFRKIPMLISKYQDVYIFYIERNTTNLQLFDC
jgi:hypothetical protein